VSFNIPNAVEFGVNIRALDQSEPDSVDFQILGNRSSGVLSGGATTTVVAGSGGGYLDITLSAVEFVFQGAYKSVSGATVTIDAAEASPRFDLICVNASTLAFQIAKGTASASNAIFPAIPANCVVLHAVFVRSAESPSALLVVDKRALISNPTVRTGTAAPSGGSQGEFYLRTGFSEGTGQSALHFKNDTGWENLATYDPLTLTPVGAIVAWPVSAVPSRWLECNGQAVSRTTYAALYALLGTTFGVGDNSTTFNRPNYNGYYLVGGAPTNASAGAATATLTTSNLPSHSHDLSAYDAHTHTWSEAGHTHTTASHNHTQNAHSHTDSHTHNTNIVHDHEITEAAHDHGMQHYHFVNGTTASNGSHTHSTFYATAGNTSNNAVGFTWIQEVGRDTTQTTSAGSHTHTLNIFSGGSQADAFGNTKIETGTRKTNLTVDSTGTSNKTSGARSTGSTDATTAVNNSATVTVNSAALSGTTAASAIASPTTDATGGGNAFSIIPPSYPVRWIIKAEQ
jgi:microcystin-dependent protein